MKAARSFLSRVVVPETVIVHDGPPSDAAANDYYVPYGEYIKNVASSEIYATWPEAAIYANVLAIMFLYTKSGVYGVVPPSLLIRG